MKLMKTGVAILFFAIINTSMAQQQIFDANKLVLTPYNYSEVKLGNSPLKAQFEEVEKYYLAISNDDLLKGFRERAGLPVNGAKDLGGWYTTDFFHVFGQLLSGMSRMYAVSGINSVKVKVKVDSLISEWAKTVDEDGYFYYTKKPNAPHYTYDKMVGGLVDAYLFAGNKQALKYLDIITDWAIKNLSKERKYAFNAQTGNTEWYTLSENLYRAYEVTKDKKYLDFGKLWEYPEYWNSFNGGKPDFEHINHHAYSHLNALNSAAAAYLVSGNDAYRASIKNAYEYFQNEQCFATGGYGPNEKLLPKNRLIELLNNSHNSFETQCGSWAIFKLSKYLIEITGDAKYGDWIEKMVINGIGADVPMTKDGKVQYFSDYNTREGTKHNHHIGWTCCTGTRPQAVAEYVDLIYFKGKDGLYVNLYTPSTTQWNEFSISQKTNYPKSAQSEFTLSTDRAGRKAVFAFRNPSWAKQLPTIFVNDKKVKAVLQNNWLKVDRIWKNGDKILITFAMNFAVESFDKTKLYPSAIMYGPVAMAVNVTNNYPYDIVAKNPLSTFTSFKSMPLNYQVKSHSELRLRPYYEFAQNEPYVMYFDSAVRNYVPESNMFFKGEWQRARGPYFTNDKSASVSTTFTGTGIILSLNHTKNSGVLNVEIDGKKVDSYDAYSTQANQFDIDKAYNNLTLGKHEIVITLSGEKNKNSKDSFMFIHRFKVIE